MDHLKILGRHQNGNGSYAGKELVSRALGSFYTPAEIGKDLAASVVAALDVVPRDRISVIDPFAGDGRLVSWLLQVVATERPSLRAAKWTVALWEWEEEPLQRGKVAIRELADELGVQIEISAHAGDTFERAPDEYGCFDLVITNPPWEVLKPDRRELQDFEASDREAYLSALRRRDDRLVEMYPLSQPKPKFSGWGTNLSRVGSEIALRLARPGGVCGIVAPASLFGDYVSRRLREWIFRHNRLTQLAFFPAEARLFESVDQPSITMTAVVGDETESSPSITVHGQNRTDVRTVVELDLAEFESDGFTLPVHFGAAPLELLSRFDRFPRFSDMEDSEGLWAGRELDETRYKEWTREVGPHPFAKGRMISRYEIAEGPSRFVTDDGPSIPFSVGYRRIAWRDVSRPTQKRRMKATVIPPGWVTGNSLSVALFRDDNESKLCALLAVMNSFVFEFQMRAFLATAHVSLSTVRKGRVPGLDREDLVKELSDLVSQRISGDQSVGPRLEVAVAKAYGLERNCFERVVQAFPKVTEEERRRLLDDGLW